MAIKKQTLRAYALPLLFGGLTVAALPAFADEKSEIERLKSLIQELDQRVKILDRKQEIAGEESLAKQKSTPVLVASEKGFGFKSADGQFEYKFRGLVQLDYRDFNSSAYPSAVNGFTARRIRPTFEGTLFGKYGFRFTPEFGESGDGSSSSQNKSRVVDAYLEARLDPAFQIRAGKFKPIVGLERLQSGSDIKFIERSYVSNNILPNRDLGVSVFGDVLDKKVSYAVGFFNGISDGAEASTAQDINSDKDITARLFTTPFAGSDSSLAGLGVGLAATFSDASTNALSSYKTPGQANNFFSYASTSAGNGKRTRWSPQAHYYAGPLGILAEYAIVQQDVVQTVNSAKLNNSAWQVAGSWLLTGEDASFKGVTPYSPFKNGGDGGWGAWELVARYQANHIDSQATTFADTAKGFALSAKTWGVGLNWYLNASSRVAINYEKTKLGDVTTGTAVKGNGEDFFVARYQVAF
jgi:phosphate-selective porin OprO/OprP